MRIIPVFITKDKPFGRSMQSCIKCKGNEREINLIPRPVLYTMIERGNIQEPFLEEHLRKIYESGRCRLGRGEQYAKAEGPI